MQDVSGTGVASGPVPADSSALPAAPPTGIAASATGVVAFVGRCLKGPLNEPVQVTSFVEYQQTFGGLWPGSTLSYAVQQYFEHGGRDALIVRVASAGRPPTLDLPAVMTRWCWAVYVRAPANSCVFRRLRRHWPQDSDLFNLVVQRVRSPGSELVEAQEIFRRLSVLAGSAREVGRMLAGSRLVRLLGRLPRQRPDISRGPDPRSVIGYVLCNKDGDDGRDLSEYDLIGSEAGRSGLFALQGGPAFNFLCIPPPAADCDLGMSALVVAARFCRRHHAMLLVDPPRAWRTAERRSRHAQWPLQSADAVMFFPWIVAKDRLTAKLATFAPSGAAAA